MTPAVESELREAALPATAAEPWRVARCNCHLAKPRFAWSSLPQCEGRIVVAAVAYRRLGQGEPEFRFVCSRHRQRYGIAESDVLGIIELPGRRTAELRTSAERTREALRRENEDRKAEGAREPRAPEERGR